MMEVHSGAADSTAGAGESWVGSTSKMRSWAEAAFGALVFAERAFGEARAGAAGGDELAGEFEEVGGDLGGRGGGRRRWGTGGRRSLRRGRVRPRGRGVTARCEVWCFGCWLRVGDGFFVEADG